MKFFFVLFGILSAFLFRQATEEKIQNFFPPAYSQNEIMKA